MCKRGNYFIAMYDKSDNYICDFNSIEECAIYFNTTKKTISDYIFNQRLREDNFRLFKIDNCNTVNLNKSQERGRI